MGFPEFLKIVSIPTIVSVKINDTHSVEEPVFENFDDTLTKILSRKMGFRYEFLFPADRKWGSPQEDGNWSGMVGVLQRQEADLIVRALTITEERQQVIDFSFPYYMGRTVFATRSLVRTVDSESFLKPFSAGVWICLLASVLVFPILHSALFRGLKRVQDAYAEMLESSDGAPPSFGECALRMSWGIAVAFVFWMYAAVLLSFLTIPTLTGVRSIPELANSVREGEYQCTAYPGSIFADVLAKSKDPDFRDIGLNLKEDEGNVDFNVVLSNPELLKTPAYIAEESKFFGLQTKYFVPRDSFFQDFRSIGIRRGFCCTAELDSAIHEIWSSGIYMKLMSDFRFRDVNKILWQPDATKDTNERALTLAHFRGIFILLTAGYVIATVVLILEIMLKKKPCFEKQHV